MSRYSLFEEPGLPCHAVRSSAVREGRKMRIGERRREICSLDEVG